MVKYEFIDIGESSTGIRINEGEYEGMSWMYGKVAFDEQSEELKLSFDYEVIENIIRDDSKTDDS